MAIGTPVLGTPSQTTVAGTTAATPAYPSTASGDIMLLLGATGSGSANIFTNPSGWTLDDQSSSTGDTVSPSILGSHKIATGSESGTLSVAHGSTVCSVGIVKMSGADPTTPVASATLVDHTAGSQPWSLLDSGAISIPRDGCTVLYVASGNNATSTYTPPSGWTELWDGVDQLASSRSWSIGYKQGVSSGTLAATSLGVSNNIRGLMIVYVIQPPASGGAHRWNGSAWVASTRKRWNGSAWV